MHCGPTSIHCIIPPYMIQALLEHKDKKIREIAMRTLTTSVRLRERRNVIRHTDIQMATGIMQRTIFDANHTMQLPGNKVRGEGDPPAQDEAVNEAYDGLGATYDLFHDVYNRNSLDDRGLPLNGTVHYSENYDNAFWDGQQMTFGDGDGVIFVGFTKAIDVIGHELTHGVVQYSANLNYHNQSGALNESFADVFGTLVKQYYHNQTVEEADWLIGSGILAPGIHGQALRSMKAPGTAYDDPQLGKDPQPDHMSKFDNQPDTEWGDWGGVHINSGITNRAFYLAASKLGGYAWEEAGHIWYAALLQLWPAAEFQDCANVTFEVAGTLFGKDSSQQQAVGDAWSTVGINVMAAIRQIPSRRGRGIPSPEPNGANLKRQLERLAREIQRTVDVMK